MLVEEWCARCERCGTVTPHARPRTRLLAALVTGLALFSALVLVLAPWPLALPTGLAALVLLSAERARRLGIACRRCRGKALRADRATRPDLRRTAFGE